VRLLSKESQKQKVTCEASFTGAQEWGFTIPQFARFYGRKFKIAEEKMCERLWGDSFFIPSEKAWKSVAGHTF
jgi:hypothetical protein